MRGKFFKYLDQTTKGAVINYTRQDLTRKWLHRIQTKSKDQLSTESFAKLSSLVDYYSKSTSSTESPINWEQWKSQIRTEGIVDKLKAKNEELQAQTYNVESLASSSAHNTDQYDKYGLLLRYNYELHMRQYSNNLKALYGLTSIGDLTLIDNLEWPKYKPGIVENVAGWRETGYNHTSIILI